MFRRLVLIFVAAAFLGFLVAMVFCLRIGPSYTSDALLIPKEQSGQSPSSGLATASRLLGIGLSGADQSSSFAKFQKYWGSRDVAAQILKKYPQLYSQLFSTNWDRRNNRWYDRPHTLRQYIATPLNWLFGVYPSYVPTAQDLADYIKGIKPQQDAGGNELQISFQAPDARFAQWFLNMVITETDNAVRQAEQRRDEDFIKFARSRLESETNVSYRDALTDSVRQFEMSNMYSEAGQNFSFQYVETPNLPITHSSPRPLLDAVLSVIFGLLMASCLVGALVLWPDSRFARTLLDLSGRLPAAGSRFVSSRIAGQRIR